MEIYLLAALAAVSTVAGYFIPWNLPRFAKLLVFLPLFGAYVLHALGDAHDLPVLLAFALVALGVVVAWQVLPHSFCGHDHGGERPAGQALSIVAVVPFLLHAAFDTELLRFANWWMLALLIAHKATDGAALRMAIQSLKAGAREPLAWKRRCILYGILALGVLATPAGLLLPEALTESTFHQLIVAFVIGFYLFLAYRMLRMPRQEAAA